MNAQPSHLVRLLRDERGSLVPMFAIILLVLIGMIGMGVDYTRGNLANAKMQAALDATALALSANAATLSASALSSQANTLFSSIYTGSKLTTPTIAATYSNTGGPQIVLTGTATLPTTFLNLPPFKMSSLNLSASSTIAWGQSRLRVALVLDNTGSMADSGKRQRDIEAAHREVAGSFGPTGGDIITGSGPAASSSPSSRLRAALWRSA